MQTTKGNVSDRVTSSAEYIKSKVEKLPEIGMILGTGLGGLSDIATNKVELSYEEIPDFFTQTDLKHSGQFAIGDIKGKTVLFMEGRFHHYDGYSMQQIAYPIRLMKGLGVKTLLVTAATGGLNPDYERADIVALTDYINFMGTSPLVGPNDERIGDRFPDMIEPFKRSLIDVAHEAAKGANLELREGVYIGVVGPQLETKSEYRMMRNFGADVVGMSTVPEVIAAVHAGLDVLGLACVTDMCIPETLQPVNIEEIIETANKAQPKFDAIIAGVLERL